MKRVMQRKIDHHSYLPVPPSFLQVGSTIEFDCCIKRFNDYVVIIYAGTEITESLYNHIISHTKIYIAKSEQEQYQRYRTAHVKSEVKSEGENDSETAEAVSVDDLGALIRKRRHPEAQISLLYKSGVALMQLCFDRSNEPFSMGDVGIYAKILADFVGSDRHRLRDFLDKMPDTYSEPNHAVNVAILAAILAKALNMAPRQLETVVVAGLLHDIGKCKVDQEILGKESELNEDEYAIVREHVLHSVELLQDDQLITPQVLSAIRYHHERLDGSGYPNRLVGIQIPEMAQVIGLCDVFDALTTDRTYRARYSSFDALLLIKREMHRQINTLHVDHLIRLLGS